MKNLLRIHPKVYKDLRRVFGMWGWISNTKWRIKAAFQRMFRGYDDSARWNLNDYVADIVIENTKWMEKNATGHPCNLKNMKEWKAILKKIRKGFEAYNKIKYATLDDRTKILENQQEEGMELFIEHFDSLWD